MGTDDDRAPRPVPGLEGRRLTREEWAELVPEKLESNWGGLGWDREECLDLLTLALVSVGLRGAIALAPRGRWLEALAESERE